MASVLEHLLSPRDNDAACVWNARPADDSQVSQDYSGGPHDNVEESPSILSFAGCACVEHAADIEGDDEAYRYA
jgi:hypothetical protein